MKHGNHPYLLINGINLRQKAEDTEFLWKPILEKAEADTKTPPIMPEDPDGWLWEVLDRTKERILRGCIAYKVTGESRFFESTKRQLWCLMDEWPWIEKFHHDEVKLNADLRTGIIMYTLGLVYDWMFDDFTSKERLRIYQAITVKGYNMFKDDIEADAFYLTSYGNNWLAVMLGGFAVAALATEDECLYSRTIIELAIERTKIMAENVGNDGAWEEGPFYWGGIAFLLMFFHIVDSLPGSKTNLMKADRLEKTALFPLYMNMPPCGRANFSDAHYYQDHNASYLFSLMASSCGNSDYQWAFHEFRSIDPLSIPELQKIGINDFRSPEETFQFLVYDNAISPQHPDLPLFKVFQGETYGFVSSRSGFGRNDSGLVLCANAGTNGTNHHQLDIGQVIITYNRHNYIYDPGYGRAFFMSDGSRADFTNYFAKNSMGHNIVTIEGQNQIDGPNAKGVIRNCLSTPEMDLFEIEMSQAYENCDFALRMVKRRRDADIVVIDDYFNLKTELPVRLAWFYKGQVEILNDSAVSISTTAGECRIAIESKADSNISKDCYSEEGCLDRTGKPLPPEVYDFIRIDVEKSLRHHIRTTFYFS